mgnify:CR=1 FL=1
MPDTSLEYDRTNNGMSFTVSYEPLVVFIQAELPLQRKVVLSTDCKIKLSAFKS